MTLARDGLREMILATLTLGASGGALLWLGILDSAWYLAAALPILAAWLFCLAFFRVPQRVIPSASGLIVSPADGRVTEVTSLPGYDGIDGPAVRIGIFLSVFDVHVNYIPCDASVVSIEHRPGTFLDARHPECGARNEANTLTLMPSDLKGPIIVRQIAGLIARRIVCRARIGDRVRRGQRFGLIKFGSRAEVIAPIQTGLTAAVCVGERVRGGSSILFRLQQPDTCSSAKQTSFNVRSTVESATC
jgi:phosphatidylserine decarboxylase